MAGHPKRQAGRWAETWVCLGQAAQAGLIPIPVSYASCLFFGLEWHGQVQPGRLQSLCLVPYVAFSLQKEEMIGGQTPSGYPGKGLSVGSGVVSG